MTSVHPTQNQGSDFKTVIARDVVIIGGGPAGLAAAVMLKKQGVGDVLIIEREKDPGGILRQCIHDGFGLQRFHESLSGPEYAARFIDQANELGIEILTDTSVLEITAGREIVASSRLGLTSYKARAIILAMGCRERTREAIRIPGSRLAGVYTAGVAQAYVNLRNIMVGKTVVILGSGDIGLIMARRLTLEGAHVIAVFEIQPHANGLPRNIEQCLSDFGIPLYLHHTVTDIKGQTRLESVTVSEVDGNLHPIPGTEKEYKCDTLIISVGLIPENELSEMAGAALDPRTRGPLVDEFYQTTVKGIFAAGNVLQVHDLVDFVSLEAEQLASSVRQYLNDGGLPEAVIPIESDRSIGYTVPQHISGQADWILSLRVRKPQKNCRIDLLQGDRILKSVRLRKAIPAEMIRIPVRAEKIVNKEKITAVLRHDENK